MAVGAGGGGGSVKESVRLLRELFGQTGFYRLLTFLLLIAFLKLILMQMYYVYPKFGIREFGDGAPVGRLWAINSILVILPCAVRWRSDAAGFRPIRW